jgi:hypothetical protein
MLPELVDPPSTVNKEGLKTYGVLVRLISLSGLSISALRIAVMGFSAELLNLFVEPLVMLVFLASRDH